MSPSRPGLWRMVAVALAAAWLSAGCGEVSTPAATPGADEAARRVMQDRAELARNGVFIALAYVHDGCAQVLLNNPTTPNRDYLRRRYGQAVCPLRAAAGAPAPCAAAELTTPRTGSVTVPDVRARPPLEAERRLVRAGLRYALTCLSASSGQPSPPNPETPQPLLLVTTQCPLTGEQVPPGTIVALQATARLPGGYRYDVGFSDRTGRCIGGREPEPG